MSQINLLASTLKSMTYDELVSVARDLVQMQIDAKGDGWRWRPYDLHGQYGMAQMLYSWAEAQEE